MWTGNTGIIPETVNMCCREDETFGNVIMEVLNEKITQK